MTTNLNYFGPEPHLGIGAQAVHAQIHERDLVAK
jgi:hypothetical protein